jgi:hypothetical protein
LEYLKGEINYLPTSSKNKNIRDLYRDINAYEKDDQHRSNWIKDEDGDLLADSHNIFNRWNHSLGY